MAQFTLYCEYYVLCSSTCPFVYITSPDTKPDQDFVDFVSTAPFLSFLFPQSSGRLSPQIWSLTFCLSFHQIPHSFANYLALPFVENLPLSGPKIL